MDPNNKPDGWNWDTCWLDVYPSDFVERAMGHLREAERITRGQPPFHARAKKTLEGFLPFEAAGKRERGEQ